MDIFMQIKDLASKLKMDLFNRDQYIIITGMDESSNKMFSYTSGDFFGVLALLSEYIEKLDGNNPLGITKYDILDMIRKAYEEDET